MLQRRDEWLTAGGVYDGDVVIHPVAGDTVTIVMMMQLRPMEMCFVSGVVEFDPLDSKSLNAIDDAGQGELVIDPSDAIYRIWRYVPNKRR
ncbi:hypothetical protein [Agrococcus sp. ProA11]|uniref:hypothetical protein n=1 Tax=Agrococcus chionoecetis TaxID=3153752 RepID=UPI003260AC7B